jgi:hypothetical protein
MHSFRFAQVNVFSTDPLRGTRSPVSVIHGELNL